MHFKFTMKNSSFSVLYFLSRVAFLTMFFTYVVPCIASTHVCIEFYKSQVDTKIVTVVAVDRVSKETFLNELRIDSNAMDRTAVERFQLNPRVDGSVAIPANISLTLTIKEYKYSNEYSAKFTTGAIAAQSKKIRNLLNNLKYRGTTHSVDGEVEFGAIIVEYLDGTTKAIRLTSNNPGSILGRHHSVALNVSLTLRGKLVKKFFYIHTHPYQNTREAPITPSAGDYLSLQELASFIDWADKPNMVGIVLPNSPKTNDVFFEIRPDGFS